MVTFHGVRGSTPCDGHQFARYGGNTSCVAVAVRGPAADDLRPRHRAAQLRRAARRGRAARGLPRQRSCSSHLHWDHVQGLPFFAPLAAGGGVGRRLRPEQDDGPLGEVFAGVMQPPYFPIRPDELGGDVAVPRRRRRRLPASTARRCARAGSATSARRSGSASSGGRLGRVPLRSRARAPYPTTPTTTSRPSVLELCDGVDLLIHDAQHTTEEYELKRHWGHCTIDYAVHVAREAGARALALFHHGPSHGDDEIDEILRDARDLVGADRRARGDRRGRGARRRRSVQHAARSR